MEPYTVEIQLNDFGDLLFLNTQSQWSISEVEFWDYVDKEEYYKIIFGASTLQDIAAALEAIRYAIVAKNDSSIEEDFHNFFYHIIDAVKDGYEKKAKDVKVFINNRLGGSYVAISKNKYAEGD